MSSKQMSLQDAIAQHVHDGDSIYLAGFTHLIPFAAGHEIIRQGRKNLTLCRATPDLIYDQMIAAGCARKLVFSWAGNPGMGLLLAFRRAVEAGELEIEEYSHFGLSASLAAGAANLPFMLIRSGPGSDLAKANPLIKTVTCPYTGQQIGTVPALTPDVAIIHAQRCDEHGNTQIWGIIGEQKEAAFAAKRVIVTAEEIVPTAVITSDPNRTVIPDFRVSAVVHAPWGAHPSYAQGHYDRDNAIYAASEQMTRTPEDFRRWLDEWVYGVSDREQYMAKLGEARMRSLRPEPYYSTPVNYGQYSAFDIHQP